MLRPGFLQNAKVLLHEAPDGCEWVPAVQSDRNAVRSGHDVLFPAKPPDFRDRFDDQFQEFRRSIPGHVQAGKHTRKVMFNEVVAVGHLLAVDIVDDQPMARIQGIQSR